MLLVYCQIQSKESKKRGVESEEKGENTCQKIK